MTFTLVPKVGAALSVPVAREIVAPFPNVRFAPLKNVLVVSVSVPLTVVAPPSVTPLPVRLMVRLFRVTAGRVMPTPEPLMTRFDVTPPVKDPVVTGIDEFRVRVFAPMDNAPLVSVSGPFVVTLEVRATPELLLIVRPLTVEGRPSPVLWPPPVPLYV